MRFSPTVLCATSAILLASVAYAADPTISPLPNPMGQESISAGDNSDDSAVMSTHTHASAPTTAPAPGLPWTNSAPPAVVPVTTPVAAPQLGTYQPKIPFGHAEAPAPIIPEGPHATVAVPVVNVDSIESSKAAPPTPVAPEADPAKEDPAMPTELTSPIFGNEDNAAPRKIVLRLLNKVTAQSQLLTFKPNETVKMGTLEITAITCQKSAPESQTDYAALVDIAEHSATTQAVKPLFRGWMYASSPSITALEHPVYDVTMVDCQMQQTPKPEEKPVKKGKK